MPAKILLADKSITIQKVVEMLFSGKEYAVMAVSDGESAVSEAARVVPDVVLADVDLPRMDGYTLSTRLHQSSQLAQTPVILMLSRDDVYDDMKGKQAGIVDHIAKPFESQDLIGKVKKALSAAPVAAPPPRPAAPAPPPSPPKSRAAVPSDIFDIIQEAPSRAEIKRPVSPPPEESVYEVEPEIEMEEPIAAEIVEALPFGEKARDEMREGLGIVEEAGAGFAGFEEFTTEAEIEASPPPPPSRPAAPTRTAARPAAMAAEPPSSIPEEMLRSVAEETIARIAREVLERIAWEVIPQLAETMIREEIERLKAETM